MERTMESTPLVAALAGQFQEAGTRTQAPPDQNQTQEKAQEQLPQQQQQQQQQPQVRFTQEPPRPASPEVIAAPVPSDGHVVHHVRFGHEAMKRRNFGHFHNHHNWAPTAYEVLIMVVMSVLSFMVALDACIIVTSLTSIIKDLGGNSTQGFWIATSYLLVHAVLMPFISKLSDIFGRPICIWLSVLVFTVGTIVCSVSQSIVVLIVGRGIQGAGAGGIVVLSLVIFTDLVPLRHRPKWYGTVQGAWGLATATGPLVGGAISDNTTWRWQFYLMFPLCAMGAVAIPIMFRLKPRSTDIRKKLMRVDWGGYLLFIASSTLFLMAISWGGTQFEWTAIGTLVPLLIGACGIIATYLYESDIALEPWLLRHLFHNITSVTTYVCSIAQGVLLYGQLYFVALWFRSVKGYSPIITAVSLLPAILTLLPAAILTGILITQTNNYRSFIWGGWTLLTAGSAMMAALFDKDTSIGVWFGTLFLIGLGHGGILNAQNVATQAMCYPGDEGVAATMYGFARHLGMALGVGIGGSTWTNFMIPNLEGSHLPVDIAAHNLAYISTLDAEPDSSEYKQHVLHSYAVAFHGLFCVFLAISALSFASSFLLKHIDMNKGFNKFGKRAARSEPLRKKRLHTYLRHFVGPHYTPAMPAVTPGNLQAEALPPGPQPHHHHHHHHHHCHNGLNAEGSGAEAGDGQERRADDEKKADALSPGGAPVGSLPPLSLGIQTPASAFLKTVEGGLVGGAGPAAESSRPPLSTSPTGATLVPRPMDAMVEEEPLEEETEEELVERLEREHLAHQDAILNSNPPSSTRSLFSNIVHSPLVSSILGSPRPSNLGSPRPIVESNSNEGGDGSRNDNSNAAGSDNNINISNSSSNVSITNAPLWRQRSQQAEYRRLDAVDDA